MAIPVDPTLTISRSFAFKLGLAGFSSADFFMSASTQCLGSQATDTADRLFKLCHNTVETDVATYRGEMEAQAQATLHPEEQTQRPAQPPPPPPLLNPFIVSERPADATPTPQSSANKPTDADAPAIATPAPSVPVEKQEPNSKLESTAPKESTTSAPAKRGRPPKTQPNAAETQPAAPPQPDPQVDGPGFKANDDDIPTALGGTSEVPPAPDRTASTTAAAQAGIAAQSKPNGPQLVPTPPQTANQMERFNGIVAAMIKEGTRTKANVDKAIKEFCRAFLNREDLRVPPHADYDGILPLLERIAELNPGGLMEDPRKLGLGSGVGWNKFIRHTEKWPAEIKEAATWVALKIYPDNCMDLLDFVNETAKLGNLDKELYTFLLVFGSINAPVAMKLKRVSFESGKSMAEIMAGQDIMKSTEGEILARIAGVTPAPAKTEAPAQSGELWSE